MAPAEMDSDRLYLETRTRPKTYRSGLDKSCESSIYSTVWFNSAPMTTAQLDRTFAALADPTRRAILERLSTGEATVSELAEPFPVSVQAVSKHLKVLEGAGLITRGRSGQLRPSRIDGAALREAAEWIDGYSSFWERGFERMERRLGG
jgi:DNA-binding transcriptional ArsR family regulator